jgi:hypothetical protein
MNFSQKYKKYRDKYQNFIQLGGTNLLTYLISNDAVPLFTEVKEKFEPSSAGAVGIINLKLKNLDNVNKIIFKINGIIRANQLRVLKVNKDGVEIPGDIVSKLYEVPTENIYYKIEKNLEAEADKARVMIEEIKRKEAEEAELIKKKAEQTEQEKQVKKPAKTNKNRQYKTPIEDLPSGEEDEEFENIELEKSDDKQTSMRMHSKPASTKQKQQQQQQPINKQPTLYERIKFKIQKQ